MKRFLSLVLSLALVLTAATTAVAETANTELSGKLMV